MTQPTLTPFQLNYADTEQWKLVMRQGLADARVATPAFLTQDMDAVTQTVTVQVALQELVQLQTGQEWWDVPPIIKVPIVLPRGGGFSLTLPLKKGDEGLLVFCDACFDFWWLSGQNNAPLAANNTNGTPSGSQIQNELRRHHVHDCGFIPGMWSQPNVLSNYSTTSMQLRSDDGTVTIDVAEAGVTVTAPFVKADNGGTPQALMTNTFYQYWVINILPFLQSKGYAGPTPPLGSETTILKGQ
jgi:hypothetical protein